MAANTPKVLGRFNYLSVREDLYNVLFWPFVGAVYMIVARNLSRKEALELVRGLNAEIDDLRRELEQEGLEEDEM